MRLLTIVLLTAFVNSRPACADAPNAEFMPSGPVLAYGDKNPACLEWSDFCVTCARESDGFHCSTPGIACQPGEITCKRMTR